MKDTDMLAAFSMMTGLLMIGSFTICFLTTTYGEDIPFLSWIILLLGGTLLFIGVFNII